MATKQKLDTTPRVINEHPNRRYGEILSLYNQQFGELTVINFAGTNKRGDAFWKCQCSCGKETIVAAQALRAGQTISCGHINRQKSAARIRQMSTTHDASNEDWYSNYASMIQRTTKPNTQVYKEYHQRHPEISHWIEEEWVANPWAFFQEIGKKPDTTFSIDRIDNHKGYVKGNVRWASPTTQTNNRDMPSRSNTGYTGVNKVFPTKENGRSVTVYQASITAHHKHILLGSFDTLEAAKIARYNAETKYNMPHSFEVTSTQEPHKHAPTIPKNAVLIELNTHYNQFVPIQKLDNRTYLCKCDCGNTFKAKGWRIAKGKVKNCNDGVKHPLQTKTIDGTPKPTQRSSFYKNKKYNHLTLIEYDHSDELYNVYWKAQCDCGNVITVTINGVLTGHNKTCGHSKYYYLVTPPNGTTERFNDFKSLLAAYNLKTLRMPTNENHTITSKRSKMYGYRIEKLLTLP